MEEYKGKPYNHYIDEVRGLIAASVDRGELMFTNFNGVRLIADPAQHNDRPLYENEMLWTCMVLLKHQEALTQLFNEPESGWSNLVPLLEKRRDEQLKAMASLDRSDPRAVLEWFVRLAPATWHRGVFSVEHMKQVRGYFDDRCEYHGWRHTNYSPPADMQLRGYYWVMKTLQAIEFKLGDYWLQDIRSYLDTNET